MHSTPNNEPAHVTAHTKMNSATAPIPLEVISQLHEQGYPRGLSKSLYENTTAFPLRIWVIDNSGSMNRTDGRRFVETKQQSTLKIVSCSRWAEIKETVDYHVDLAALLNAPTIFRMLNASAGIQQFSIADKGYDTIQPDVFQAKDLIHRVTPSGTTPLTRHLYEIKRVVQDMAPSLQVQGKKVAIILATDGLPSNDTGISDRFAQEEFINELRSLNGLPIWLVIRLCTDEDSIAQFYNDLDAQLEMSVETLDDFESEAQEVYKHNDWINYTLPLHRCREMGYHNRLLDLIDERPLSKSEVREYCILIFGLDAFDCVPDADADWNGFLDAMKILAKNEKKQWNPIKKKPTKWISIGGLASRYSHCTIQ